MAITTKAELDKLAKVAKSKTKATTTKAKAVVKPVAKIQQPKPSYSLPAIRGIQAGREYYVCMVPVSLLPKLFPHLSIIADRDETAIEYRYQRQLDNKRANALSDYILAGMGKGDIYTLSSASSSVKVDGMEFIPYADGVDLGTLCVPMDGEFYLFDGQHRIRGLILAAINNAEIKDETISLVLYCHVSVTRDQQAFADMNGNARVPSKSLSLTFDHRDSAAALSRKILDQCPSIKALIDFERSGCSGKNARLFPFQGFHRANQILVAGEFDEQENLSYAVEVWETVCENIAVYAQVKTGEITAAKARETSVAVTQVALEAIAHKGKEIRSTNYDKRMKCLRALVEFDWSRTNPDVVAATTKDGRMVKNPQTIADLSRLIFDESF
jgi:DNA sulfur modification protein DndB